MAIVLHHCTHSGTAKLVALGIANHDGDGGAWPSIATLAKYASVSERQVQRALRDLEADGVIEVAPQGGGTHKTPDMYRPNLYRLTLSCPPECDRTAQHKVRGDTHVTPQPGSGVTPTSPLGVTPMSPEPSLEPSSEPSTPTAPERGVTVREAEFEAWWSEYPKKMDKRGAWTAYWKARETVTPITLLEGAKGYARLVKKEGTETKFVTGPANWLNNGRWNDEYPPPIQKRSWSFAAGNE